MNIFEKIVFLFDTMFNSKTSSNSILADLLGDTNLLKRAHFYDFYQCEKFGTFPFPTNVQPSYFCAISCYNCCKISKKSQINQTSNTCPKECVSREKIAWSSCSSTT